MGSTRALRRGGWVLDLASKHKCSFTTLLKCLRSGNVYNLLWYFIAFFFLKKNYNMIVHQSPTIMLTLVLAVGYIGIRKFLPWSMLHNYSSWYLFYSENRKINNTFYNIYILYCIYIIFTIELSSIPWKICLWTPLVSSQNMTISCILKVNIIINYRLNYIITCGFV